MKSILKKTTSSFYNRPIINYFDKKYKKRVLISYIVYPFRSKDSFSHSNTVESQRLVKIFDQLGYVVDIYDYNYAKSINFNKYDVIFGIGQLFEKSLKFKDKSNIFIYYATGAYFCFQNRAELQRIKMLYERKNVLLKPKRIVKNSMFMSSHLADYIVMTGNDWTKSTFELSNCPKFTVPQSVFDVKWKSKLNPKVISNNKNFLWFGGTGLVHKGLDLTLEVFKDLQDFNLYICGPKEDDFFELYKDELSLANIHYLGFVNIHSLTFKKVVDICNFSIFPSCSEGGAGSLLQCMSLGLIPIATIETGADFKDYGYVINDNINEIRRVVIEVSELDQQKLTELSNSNMTVIKSNHGIENYELKMKDILGNILGNYNGREN